MDGAASHLKHLQVVLVSAWRWGLPVAGIDSALIDESSLSKGYIALSFHLWKEGRDAVSWGISLCVVLD